MRGTIVKYFVYLFNILLLLFASQVHVDSKDTNYTVSWKTEKVDTCLNNLNYVEANVD